MKNSVNKAEKKNKVWPVLLCLLLAGGVFALLLSVEAKQMVQYEKGSVVVAIADVADCKGRCRN